MITKESITLGFTIISICNVSSSMTRCTALRFIHKLFVLKILRSKQKESKMEKNYLKKK